MDTKRHLYKSLRDVRNKLLHKHIITTRVLQDLDPKKWKEHFFGLTHKRWKSLQGKSFWITGAGTGYGRCLACALAAAGARLFLTGRRLEKLQETIEEMKTLKITTESCFLIQADISDPKQIPEASERVKGLCEALNGLVNNAAIPSTAGILNPLEDDSLESWNQMMMVNVTAPWLLTRANFAHMLRTGCVRVLFVSSEAGWASTLGVGIYNITKAALNSLTHSIAEEYTRCFPHEDIQINGLVPGEAKTEMNQGSSKSPYTIVSMALILLSHPKGGPNGKFFHADGRHLSFGYTEPYSKHLI